MERQIEQCRDFRVVLVLLERGMLPITKNIFAYESTQTGIARFNIWKKCCDYTHLWDMQLTRYCRQGVADKDVLLTRIGFHAERWGAFCIIGSLEDQYR